MISMTIGGEIMGEIILLLLAMVVLMVVLKMLFGEMDGRSALKRGNIKYFLEISKGFKYNRAIHIVLLLVFSFVLFTDISIFTVEGMFVFAIFLCVGVISDIISQVVYYKYVNARFKVAIKEALNLVKQLKEESEKPFFPEEIISFNEKYSFKEVLEKHLYSDDHAAFITLDGGHFVNSVENLPRVSYVIDGFEESAKYVLENRLVKILNLTKDKLLPFKKERLDVFVNKDLNYNFSEVFRVLKEDGSFILNQIGSNHLLEIGAMFFPLQIKASWDVETCEQQLNNAGFVVLEQGEDKGQIRFRSMSAIMYYFKTIANDKVENMESYINQFALIYRQIKAQGYFMVSTHKFYIVAKKRSGMKDSKI